MKILLSWLNGYIETNLTSDQIGKTLTSAGLEVDAIDKIALKCEGVIVCKVLEVNKHPQADKLCLATVTDGQQTYEVVCGASNCRAGLKTALAPLGARVLDENGQFFTIKKSKIRGIESNGMLCAGDELGLKGVSEGIIELSSDAVEGTDVAKLYDDTVFEISLTPNLGHASSVIGVARELSAATGKKVQYPVVSLTEDHSSPISKAISVEVSNKTDCPRYTCRIIKNITIAPSPDWLKNRLEASGIRSINNVVDVTNYVMHEMGQPLHAFDYDMLADHRLNIRNAKAGEIFISLDGKERTLEEKDLLICDANKAVALAGVMGGINSEVNLGTHNLLLESAYFLPSIIRRTSKRLGLITDASKRFERGCDPNAVIKALDRASMLIQQVAGGQICEGVIDIAAKTFTKKRIICRLSRINRLLGTRLSVGEVETIFNKLDFTTVWDGQDVYTVDVPTYRNDLQEEIDLVEEVARIYGYDNLDRGSNRFSTSTIPPAPIYLFEKEINTRLIAEGLQEFLTCDLIGPSLLDVVGVGEMPEKTWVRVMNPVSIEQSILRTSLLPGLLQVVKYNWDRQNHDIAGFEIGRIHFKEGDHYCEQSMAAIVLSGKSAPHHWDEKAKDSDFYDLKGIVENVLNELRIADISFRPNQLQVFHSGRQASIFAGELEIGSLGEVHPTVLRRLDVPQRILFAEINLHDLYKVKAPESKMHPLPIYPGSERDWTITLKEEIPLADILKAIHTIPSKTLENVSLLDIYRSDKLGQGMKNATLRFMYRDWEKTISQEQVDAEHASILTNIKTNLLIG